MTPAARVAAAIELLDAIETGIPAEQALTRWARKSRFAGSKDRAAIRDLVFDALRHWRSDAARGGGTTGRARMLGRMRANGTDPKSIFTGEGHAPATLSTNESAAGSAPRDGAEEYDLSDWLWTALVDDQRVEASRTAKFWQSRAPVSIRVNTRLSDVGSLVPILASDGIVAVPNLRAKQALTIEEGARRLHMTQSFQDGLFELQDASSQAVVDALPDAPRALDYCAGGGGKALALAARGTFVTAHDIDPKRMKDLPDRAERASVAIEMADRAELTLQYYDIVLCDAPCSGSGAWRRHPEGKKGLTQERLQDLSRLQLDVLKSAVPFVAPDGVLAYATCSVFSAENEKVVAQFVERHPEWHVVFEQRWPVDESGDGFYSAHLRRE